ncbi:OmpH family outer membrane protein [Marinifilum sp. N1E240]|jgi:outer membrane protein|uniref:OmpH family outer membrane protein n=1 Tax=Marinifilum sp. N1E240 TaxID=2608082 RepID=UPI00128B291D|nr:OmpH family outer membrane protein [Marinifilum sp. N1E240]MPQ45861.1 OmpH family outer membrane protein [Marinifilum sp. N1E240]
MRQFLKVTLVAIFLFTGANLFAQTAKFGHIDSNKLLSIMPEKAEAQKQIQAKAAEYDNQIKAMREEYQTLVNSYVEQRETLSEALRATKEKEIQDLQNRMQTFDGFAQQELQKTQNELLKPIFDKASKAIKDVGAENGFTYVFDISTGVILHFSDNSVDVMPLVKAKLGIQ